MFADHPGEAADRLFEDVPGVQLAHRLPPLAKQSQFLQQIGEVIGPLHQVVISVRGANLEAVRPVILDGDAAIAVRVLPGQEILKILFDMDLNGSHGRSPLFTF